MLKQQWEQLLWGLLQAVQGRNARGDLPISFLEDFCMNVLPFFGSPAAKRLGFSGDDGRQNASDLRLSSSPFQVLMHSPQVKTKKE